MPIYCYQCRSCEQYFEIRHSMSFEEQVCLYCESKDVFKIPSLPETVLKPSTNQRIGKVVDDYIRDTRKEVKKEKQNLKNREL